MHPNKSFRLEEIVARLGGILAGDASVDISQVGSLNSARPGQIAFLVSAKYRDQLKTTQASAVILSEPFAGDTALPKIIHPNPYAYYARVVALLNPKDIGFSGVHSSALSQSPLPASARIAERVVIGKNVSLGENVVIYPGCVIGDHVSIGSDCLLYPNVVIYDHCVIGCRAVIQAGAVIGSEGFGFAKDGEAWLKIPQIGRVIIGDDVEIGVNTAIDRGALDDTVIGNGVKLDNLIQIAHNVTIGDHTAMAACVGIAGSVKIGRSCTLGGAAMISGHIEFADGVHISGGTVVSKSLHRPGLYTGVFPLDTHDNWLQHAVGLKRLTKLTDRLQALEKKLQEMEKSP